MWGVTPEPIRDPEDPADLAWTRRATLDVLQRTPTPAELRTRLGAPRRLVAARTYATLEAMQVWLEEELYHFLLIDNFRPRTRAIRTLPQRLLARQVSVRDAIAEIMLTTSFSLRNPGNDTFVTVVLEQGLGLTVQKSRNRPILAAGKRMYDGERVRFLGAVGSSQADVIRIVLSQRRFSEHLLDRHHRRLFGEPLPLRSKAARAVVDELHRDPYRFFPILARWIASDDYHARLARKKPRSDHQFVRSLYMDLLGRTPDYQELRNMRNALQSMADSSPLRAVLAKVILDSGKARIPECEPGGEETFVRTCFLRYLGREPSQRETARFAGMLREGECEPAHVVRALVQSPEYQYY